MALTHSPAIITEGLVLHLDAGNPRSYPRSGTAWRDLSRRGNDGTLTNGPTFSSANGGGVVFDGTNDYVNISPSGYNLGVNFTLQLWTRIIRFGGNVGTWNRAGLISNSYPYSSNQGFVFIATSQAAGASPTPTPGRETFFISAGNDQFVSGAAVGSLTSYVDKWVNLSAVVDGTNLIRLYINGVEVLYSSQGSGPSALSYTGGPFLIGARNNTEDLLQGSISNIFIYNRSLSALQIQQNFNATRGRFGV